MTSLLYNYTYYLHGYWYEIQDERTKDLPLVAVHPLTMTSIMLAYFLFVTKFGPMYMKDRAPFQLRKLMFVYNFVMVGVNGFYLYEALRRSDYLRRFLDFQYPDRSIVSTETMEEINLGWWYWMSKFADWFDTFFYVLRKKESHINFLHLYHHISVPTFGYMIMKINPILPSAHLFIVVNTFVHCCMYSYYALAAMGPTIRRYLWWKRYITVLQLGQFAIGIVYGMIVLCLQTGYPSVWLYFGLTQPPFFFWMFYNFYQKTYTKTNSVNGLTAQQHIKSQ